VYIIAEKPQNIYIIGFAVMESGGRNIDGTGFARKIKLVLWPPA
jgi:hypothetical protein